MGEMGGADVRVWLRQKQAVSDAAENYLPWYNEGCVGTMTVNNSFQADDPTIRRNRYSADYRNAKDRDSRDFGDG